MNRPTHQPSPKTPGNTYTVASPVGLLDFLIGQMQGKSRTAVKKLLTYKQIAVDNKITTKFDYNLQAGQTVTIYKERPLPPPVFRELRIVFEDEHLIVIEKNPGLLSMATDRGAEKTAYSILSDYVKKSDYGNKIFIVHRLDRETSGLMLFAKSPDVQEMLQEDWQETVSERTYVALVEGGINKDEGTIVSWLKENKVYVVYSSPTPNGGQKAITHYRVIQKTNRNTLVDLQLETGRKNQIRVHMQDIGHPICGDKKYGGRFNDIGRLGLHARVLAFRHPVTGEQLHFETPIPPKFLSVFG